MPSLQPIILLNCITYLLFFGLLWLSKKKRGLRLVDEHGLVQNHAMLLLLHFAGIILFGMLPLLNRRLSPLALFNSGMFCKLSTWITLATAMLVVFTSVQLAEKRFRASAFDLTRINTHTKAFIVLYLILRILFIAAYETWFRGYLLNDSIASIGLLWAFILNIVLYCVLHIVNGRAEVMACIPFGLLLGALCLWTGAVWPAILVHLALTISYEWAYLRKIKTLQKLPYEYTDNRRVGLSRQ